MLGTRRVTLQKTPTGSRAILALNKFAAEQPLNEQQQLIRQHAQALQCSLETTRIQVSSRRICQEGTEEDLCRADAEERAVRSLGRILAAGTPFVFQDHYDNRVTMQDFKLLLGDLFNPSEFQPNSGRAFLAGVFTRLFGFKVTLTHIRRWFTKPSHGKLIVSAELVSLLAGVGMSWPPNADKLHDCQAYVCKGPCCTLLPTQPAQVQGHMAEHSSTSSTASNLESGAAASGEKQLGWYMVETTEPAEEHPEDSAHLDFHMSDSPVHLDWQFV